MLHWDKANLRKLNLWAKLCLGLQRLSKFNSLFIRVVISFLSQLLFINISNLNIRLLVNSLACIKDKCTESIKTKNYNCHHQLSLILSRMKDKWWPALILSKLNQLCRILSNICWLAPVNIMTLFDNRLMRRHTSNTKMHCLPLV